MEQDPFPKVGSYREKRLSQTQKWHPRASKGLAQVRKLLRPATTVQVNVAIEGGQQVSIEKWMED